MQTITFENKMWKKLTAITVVGSLLFSFIPPYSQAFNQSSKPESYKLRKQLLLTNFEKAEDKVIQLAQASAPPEKLPIMLDQYRDGLKRSGIKRASSRTPRLSSSHFRISSLRQTITSLTALHAGPLLMHIRKIHENYSLLNMPQSFGFLFRAVLDGRSEFDSDWAPHKVGRYDDKWEFVVHAGNAWSPYLLPRFLTRVMSQYLKQWEVLKIDIPDWKVSWNKQERKSDEIKTIIKAERTIGDYLVKPLTEEEFEFIKEFREIYEELIDDEYEHLGLDRVFVAFYDGPGFVWSEDISLLAYFIFEQQKLNGFDKNLDIYPDRKDEDWWRSGDFFIDRRYGRILIEYGKKYGKEALRALMRTHAERELLGQTHMTGDSDIYNQYDEQTSNFDTVHEDILDWPGQKGLVEFAHRAANDIRLGDFPDYIFVRDLVGTMKSKNGNVPENTIGILGNYLLYLYLNVKDGKDQSGQFAQTLNDVFLLIRRDQELYLEYRAKMEELLSRRASQAELESLNQAFLQVLKEKEREELIQGFAIRNPRFARLFGMDLIQENIDALVEFERKVDQLSQQGVDPDDFDFSERSGKRPPGEWSYEIFDQVFREIKEIVTSKNVMAFAEDILGIVQVGFDASLGGVGLGKFPAEIIKDMMKHFGPERTAKKLHSLVKFANDNPGFGLGLLRWRIDLEGNFLKWLRPDTYARAKKEKKKGQYKSWMERTREKHGYEKFYSLIPFVAPFVGVLLYAPFGHTLEPHTSLNIWNEIGHSVSDLLPYFTVGLVSVALGASFDREDQKLIVTNNAGSARNEVEEAIIDISKKAGDSEDVVKEILTPSLYQALSGIVRENPIRVFLNRSDFKDRVENLKRLLDLNEGDRRIVPVITINREFKEKERTEVEIELRDHGIDPKKVEIIAQPMTWDGKFSLRALLLDHPELLEGGYSMWVLNRNSWIDLVFESINEMRLDGGTDLVELELKGDLATKLSQ